MSTAATGFAAGLQTANNAMPGPPQRLRVLMLHSFRTSAAIFKQQVHPMIILLCGTTRQLNTHIDAQSRLYDLQMQISGLDRQLNDLVEMVRLLCRRCGNLQECSLRLCVRLKVRHRETLSSVAVQIFVDAPHAASGPIPKDVEPYFDPPFREWWNFTKQDADGSMQYIGFDESVAYVETKLREHAPIHGLCGFSQVCTCPSCSCPTAWSIHMHAVHSGPT